MNKLLMCSSCGLPLRGHAIKGKRYYHDTARDYREECSGPYGIKAELLEDKMGVIFTRLRLPSEWQRAVLARVAASRGSRAN